MGSRGKKLLSKRWVDQVPSTSLISRNTILFVMRDNRNNRPLVALILINDIIIHFLDGVDEIINTLTRKGIISKLQRQNLLEWPCNAEKADNLLSLIYSAGEEKDITFVREEICSNQTVAEAFDKVLDRIENAEDCIDLGIPEKSYLRSSFLCFCETTSIASDLEKLMKKKKDTLEDQVFRRNATIESIIKSDKTVRVLFQMKDQWQVFNIMRSIDTDMIQKRLNNWFEVQQSNQMSSTQIELEIDNIEREKLQKNFNEGVKLKFAKTEGTKKMHVLIVGQTGSGKSSLFNFILSASPDHKPDKVYSKIGGGSVSTTVHNIKRDEVVEGVEITLVDTPGVYNRYREEEPKLNKEEIIAAVNNSNSDYDAIIYVTKVFSEGLKMNKPELKSLDLVAEALGEKIWDHTVMVFTFGKMFEHRMKMEPHPETFQEHLKQYAVTGNRELIGHHTNKVHNAAVLVDNEETNAFKRDEMITSLLTKINDVIKRNDGKGYGKNDLPKMNPVNIEEIRQNRSWEIYIHLAIIVFILAFIFFKF